MELSRRGRRRRQLEHQELQERLEAIERMMEAAVDAIGRTYEGVGTLAKGHTALLQRTNLELQGPWPARSFMWLLGVLTVTAAGVVVVMSMLVTTAGRAASEATTLRLEAGTLMATATNLVDKTPKAAVNAAVSALKVYATADELDSEARDDQIWATAVLGVSSALLGGLLSWWVMQAGAVGSLHRLLLAWRDAQRSDGQADDDGEGEEDDAPVARMAPLP